MRAKTSILNSPQDHRLGAGMKNWSPEVKAAVIGVALTATFAGCGFLIYNYYEHPGTSLVEFYVRMAAALLVADVPLYVSLSTGLAGVVFGLILSRASQRGRAVEAAGQRGRPAASASAVIAPSQEGSPKDSGCWITRPRDGERLAPGTIVVEGTFERQPPEGKQIVLVASRDGAYYPQGRLQVTGPRSWRCRWDIQNPGEVTLAIGTGDRIYLAKADEYFEKGRSGKGWHAIRLGVPPDGLHVEHTIEVRIETSSTQ